MQSNENDQASDGRFVELVADGERFLLSHSTLDANPEFIVTLILKGTVSPTSCPHVQMESNEQFLFDVDPSVMKSVVSNLRKASVSTYSATINASLFPVMKGGSHVEQTNQITQSTQSTQSASVVVNQARPTEKTSIFKRVEDTKRVQPKFVEFSAMSDKPDGAPAFINLLGANVESASDRTASVNFTPSVTRTNNLNDSVNTSVEFSASSTMRESSAPPKGHHIYRSRKVEVDTSGK
ncbi:hypothetical protein YASMINEVIRUS_860 [Yasminevirus sp. GU-2018]|uniref:Uncharacterized protein n=1 Tax=Yasminevirus sp. GU-2018 TaxID=2420051 RepID=A0A5K0U905_9VIRU|nr:hypothetical protein YASMINEVIRUS_860 [Yasminevirus sp. GU-2018]